MAAARHRGIILAMNEWWRVKGALQRASAGVAKGSISPIKENAMTLRSERRDVTNRK